MLASARKVARTMEPEAGTIRCLRTRDRTDRASGSGTGVVSALACSTIPVLARRAPALLATRTTIPARQSICWSRKSRRLSRRSPAGCGAVSVSCLVIAARRRVSVQAGGAHATGGSAAYVVRYEVPTGTTTVTVQLFMGLPPPSGDPTIDTQLATLAQTGVTLRSSEFPFQCRCALAARCRQRLLRTALRSAAAHTWTVLFPRTLGCSH